MIRCTVWLGLLLGALAGASPAAAGDRIQVKMATMAPEGTTWYNALRELGERWDEITGGLVEVKLYPGGVAGTEATQIRKIRIGQLHGTALSNIGLREIDPAPQVTQVPLLIESNEELVYVAERLAPELEARLLERGFVVLGWSEVGWVHFFTKKPLKTPEEFGRIQVAAWDGDPTAVEGFRRSGLNPVVIQSVDLIPSLQSGLVDGFPNAPLYALSTQSFALAPNMLDLPWAPLMGATVIGKDKWDEIPAEYHEEMLAAAREINDAHQAEIRRQHGKSIEVMVKYGLNVVEVDEATRALWEEQIRASYPYIREEILPAEIFDRAVELVEEYRAQQP